MFSGGSSAECWDSYPNSHQFLMYEPDEVSMITQKRLKSILHYSKESGKFTSIHNKHKWKKGKSVGCRKKDSGYIVIRIDDVLHRAHRLAFLYINGEFPSGHVDHINGIRDDNRWSNIRAVTEQENSLNTKMYKTNKSGIPGVYVDARDGSYYSQIWKMKKVYCLYSGRDFFEAVCARKSAEVRHGFHANHGRKE